MKHDHIWEQPSGTLFARLVACKKCGELYYKNPIYSTDTEKIEITKTSCPISNEEYEKLEAIRDVIE